MYNYVDSKELEKYILYVVKDISTSDILVFLFPYI